MRETGCLWADELCECEDELCRCEDQVCRRRIGMWHKALSRGLCPSSSLVYHAGHTGKTGQGPGRVNFVDDLDCILYLYFKGK